MNWKDAPVTRKCTSRVGGVLLILITIFALFATIILDTKRVAAATSSTINFQARLMTAGGAIVPDGFYNVEFKLYDAASSSGSSQGSCTGDAACLWTETRTGVNTVRVANGYLTASLGSITAFPSTINWNQELWLSMNIGGTSGSPVWDGPMTPRLKLTAVAYAFRAGQLANTNGSFTSTVDFVQPTANRSILVPNESGTICLQSSINCGFVTGSSSDYIQNQNASDQTANFRINGTGRAAVAFQAPLFDTATATALGIGTTNATAINLNKSTVITGGLTQSGGTISLTGNGASSFTTSTGTIDIRAGGTSTVTLNTSGAGTVNVGTDSTTTINIGGGTDVARTIRLGSPTSGTAAQTVIVGSQNTTSTTLIQGGTGPSAIAVQPATNGTIGLTTTGTGIISLQTGNKVTVQSTTDSLQAVQIQDAAGVQILGVDSINSRIGINVDFPEVSLDVSGAIQQTGLLTSDSGGSFSNQWTKLGSCQINDQYAQCFTVLNITGGNDGLDNNNTQATVSARVKQQDPLGSAPIVDLTLNGVARVITADDIKLVTTQNNGTATIVELWGRITIGFEHWQYTPTINTGGSFWAPWVWTPVNGFQAALPVGTQTAATYGTTFADTLTIKSMLNASNIVSVQDASATQLFGVASTGATSIATIDNNSTTIALNVANASSQSILSAKADGTIGIGVAASSSFVGKNTIGASTDLGDSNSFEASRYTTPSLAGAVSSIWVYTPGPISPAPNNKFKAAIYTESGGQPGSRVAVSSEGTLTVGWNSVPISTTLSASTVYWIVLNTNGTNNTFNNWTYDSGGTTCYSPSTYANNFPTTFPDCTPNITSTSFSFYAPFATNSPAINVTSIGDVGLGTVSPAALLDVRGTALFRNATNSTTAFQIQNSSSVSLLTVDTATTQRVRIGPSGGDATGTLLLLGTKTGSTADPGTPINGSIYYNATSSRFRCYEASAWKDCVYGFNTITKASDQPANQSSTAFQNDTTLFFPVSTTSNYEIDAWIPIDNSNGTAGGKFTFTVPSGSTLNLAAMSYSSATANTICNITTSGQTCILSASSAVNFIQVRGFVRTGGSTGNIQFQFAQNVSTAVSFPVVKKGATISWHQ